MRRVVGTLDEAALGRLALASARRPATVPADLAAAIADGREVLEAEARAAAAAKGGVDRARR